MTPQEIKALTVEGLTDKVESLSTMVELLKAERDAAMREASELAMSIWRTEFKKLSPDFDLCDSPAGVISQIDNMYAAIRAQRDALAAQVEKLKERNRKLDVDLLRALFYAPSSPVSPDKAYEIEAWYGKFKQVHLVATVRQGGVE